MDVKKVTRKIVALGMGATMLGATVMGASAQLENYPNMWIDKGVFDGKIVVGKDAATSDVLGAIDLAASIQAASVIEKEVLPSNTPLGKKLKGDAVEISESGDLLSLNEPIGDVRETITQNELSALRGGVISTDEGSTAYKQYLRFKTASSSELFPTAVIYGENNAPKEEVGDWLFIAEGNDPTADAFFEWEIEFEEGLESEMRLKTGSSSVFELDDLEDEVFNIFGTDFVFVDSQLSGTCAAPDLTIEFLAGDVTDVLQEGETKTYTIDGKDYEVTLVFVSNPNSGSVEAKFSVNGELSDALGDGDTDILSDGMEIGIQEILVSSRGAVVEFFLGATKVQFRDTNTSNGDGSTNNGFHNGVEVTNEKIEEGWVRIMGQCIGGSGSFSSGDEFEITSIKYRLTADAVKGSTNIYVPPGHGVREFLDEPEGLLSPNFNIRYEGFLNVAESPIEIYSRGDDEYRMRMTNRQGNTYDIPYVEVTRSGVFRFGEDSDEDLIFIEDSDFDAIRTNGNSSLNLTASDFFVDQDDKIVIWNGRSDVWHDQAFSHVLEYESIDTNQKVLTFQDLATGTKQFTYKASSNADPSIIGEGDLVVGGNAYKVYVSSFSGNPIAVDINADGAINGGRGRFAVRGGGIIEFDNRSSSPAEDIDARGTPVGFVLHTEASQLDESREGGEELMMDISEASGNQVAMAFASYNRTGMSISGAPSTIDRTQQVYLEGVGVVNTTGRYAAFRFDPSEPDDQRNHELEATDFGVLYDLYDPTGNEPEELTLLYPHSERGVQVFVTAGTVSSSPTKVTTTEVNPIAVGLAVLDVDAPKIGTQNLIVVGGPCVNSVAAELLGVDYPACGEDAAGLGFEPGKAVIKLFESKNALLVAGYDAQDTLGATYVLADHDDYDLEGTEVEVVVADLDSITVNIVG